MLDGVQIQTGHAKTCSVVDILKATQHRGTAGTGGTVRMPTGL